MDVQCQFVIMKIMIPYYCTHNGFITLMVWNLQSCWPNKITDFLCFFEIEDNNRL